KAKRASFIGGNDKNPASCRDLVPVAFGKGNGIQVFSGGEAYPGGIDGRSQFSGLYIFLGADTGAEEKMPAASAKIIFDAGRVPYLADPWQGLGYVGKSQNRQKHEKGLVKSLIKAGNKAGKKQDHQQRRSRPLYDKLQDAAV